MEEWKIAQLHMFLASTLDGGGWSVSRSSSLTVKQPQVAIG